MCVFVETYTFNSYSLTKYHLLKLETHDTNKEYNFYFMAKTIKTRGSGSKLPRVGNYKAFKAGKKALKKDGRKIW